MTTPSAHNPRAALELKVGIAQILIARETGLLKTLLGSCIGLTLFDDRRRIGGMAHILLPHSSGSDAPAGKFADTAIPELIRLLEAAGSKSRHLTAKLAGGANMFLSSAPRCIGEQNLAAVLELLKQHLIPVMAIHCGGNQGRRMTLDVANGDVLVEIVGQAAIKL